jgi:hypothetical protein
MRKKYKEKYDLKNLVLHVYNIFSNLDEIGTS